MPDDKPRLLVVEDELSIATGLCDVLSFRGYAVESVMDGKAALSRCAEQRYDLVLLDVMLPEFDGLSVCQQLRARGFDSPIVMLTARGSEEDILLGFSAGADDYVTKPFSVRELLARVQVRLKRSLRAASECFQAGPFEIDPARSVARCDDSVVELTKREVQILRLLAEDPGRIVSRRVLLREAWELNNADALETRTVDMHIAKLRKKLGKPADGLVMTVRGQGVQAMQQRALIRLRIGFVLLAAALLVPLGILARSMHAKLEAQDRLRHEIVAERIFDEMERELTQLLQREAERPSAAYEARSTLVSNWAPFVVGYYTRDASGTHIVAESQLTAERAQRLRSAVSRLPALVPPPLQPVAASAPEPASARTGLVEKKSALDKASPAAPEQVLKQLNRSAGERERAYKRKSSVLREDSANDPLSGLD